MRLGWSLGGRVSFALSKKHETCVRWFSLSARWFFCWYGCISCYVDVKRLRKGGGAQEAEKTFNWKYKDTDFYRCETTIDAKFEGSGLKVQEMWFFLCWASTMSAQGFPCWLRGWGHPYCRFSIVVSPQTYPTSRESVVCVYGDDETPSSALPRWG